MQIAEEFGSNQTKPSPNVEATIVVTTHNRPGVVDDAVADALAQTLSDIEVVVVDDGSDRAYRPAFHDPRLRVVRIEPSQGVCSARNVGLQQARGRWITYLDDDDRLLPHMLERSIAAMAASTLPQPVAAISAISEQTRDGEVVQVHWPVTLPRGRRYHLEPLPEGRSWNAHNTFVAPVAVLREIGGWDERLRSFPHSDLFLRLNAACSLQGLDEITYKLIVHEGERRTKDPLAIARSIDHTTRKHWQAYKQLPDRTASMLRQASRSYLDAGQWRAALSVASRAARVQPLHAHTVRTLISSLAGPRARSMRQRWSRRRTT